MILNLPVENTEIYDLKEGFYRSTCGRLIWATKLGKNIVFEAVKTDYSTEELELIDDLNQGVGIDKLKYLGSVLPDTAF